MANGFKTFLLFVGAADQALFCSMTARQMPVFRNLRCRSEMREGQTHHARCTQRLESTQYCSHGVINPLEDPDGLKDLEAAMRAVQRRF